MTETNKVLNKAKKEPSNGHEQKGDTKHKLSSSQIIAIVGIFIALVLFVLGLLVNITFAFSVGYILLTIFVGIFAHAFDKVWKILSFILFGILLVIVAILIPSHPKIAEWVYTPTPSPTAFPTCADIECPTVEVTPCPTYEITPCPTCEVVQNPVEPTLTQPVPSPTPTVPWNFQDGCIFYDWRYIPDTWEYKVRDDEACGGFDYSFFGFEVKELRGLNVLSISHPSADGIYDFGIYRNFTEGLSYLKIEFTVENIIHGLENSTYFNIGFGKTPDLRNFEGSYLRIYNTTTDEYISIKILDELHPNYENSEKWLGYISKGSTVTIECDEVFDRRIKCDYMLDGLLKFEDLDIYLPKDWDSIYIGYEMPKGGTIEIYIDEIVVKQ